jgi:hypothetical protein
MTLSQWANLATIVGSLLTPLTVAFVGVMFARRQSRSDQLQKVRLDYYQELSPDLNRLMCYMTYIGTWRDDSPVEVVQLKRKLDARFASAIPLFSPEVSAAYTNMMRLTFATFGLWGHDARILTSGYRRRRAWQRIDQSWQSDWDERFALGDSETISGESLADYRDAYDALISAMVHDLSLSRARDRYTTDLVSLNASAPIPNPVEGSEST